MNLAGQVVGVNAAIATANSGGLQMPGETVQTGSIGIGFAIPSDEASRIAAELISTGSATHAVLGIQVAQTSHQSSITILGATITSVTPNGPAAIGGLQVGDIVTKVQNQLIIESIDLTAAVRSFAPHQTIIVAYTRSGSFNTATITLGSASS